MTKNLVIKLSSYQVIKIEQLFSSFYKNKDD